MNRCAFVLLAALALGCAAPVQPAPVAAGASLRTVVLLPLGVVAPVPSELEEGAPLVEAALQAYLRDAGKQVVRLAPGDAQAEWTASSDALRADVGPDAMSFEGAARQLAQRLRARQSYDALVIPSLAFHAAKLRTRRVSWDGVDRRLETIGEGGDAALADRFHGAIEAPSLEVRVFSPQGELLFQGSGGLDLAHRAHVLERSKTTNDLRWELELRPELFTDAPLLREGVAVAFDPFLSRSD